MSVNDTIADYLTRIRNGYRAGHDVVCTSYSKILENISAILAREGFIAGFEVVGERAKKSIVVRLKYIGERPAITHLERKSKLSRRVYAGYRELSPVRDGFGRSIISTPLGLLTDEEARRKKVGGEVLFVVW